MRRAALALLLTASLGLIAASPIPQRRAAFNKCYEAAFDKRLKDFIKETGDACGSCSGMRDEAVQDCARFLTKEEQDCEANAEYGIYMGDPFRCEDEAQGKR